MIDLTNQKILSTGWAGPLLWVITEDNISIHLFDSNINLKNREVYIGEDVSGELQGKEILNTEITSERFDINFRSGISLSIGRERYETLRVFKKGSGEPHYLYQNGVFRPDTHPF